MNLLQRIDEWKARAPRQVAVRNGDRSLTYAELVDRSNALAAQLLQLLPADRSPIAVRGHKEPEMLIAFLGAVKAGHPYIPIDRSIPEERVARMLSIAGVRLVLMPDQVRELSSSPADRALSPVQPGDPYYIIFTSGSTGMPKGVLVSQANVRHYVDWTVNRYQITEQDRVSQTFDMTFDLSAHDMFEQFVLFLACNATSGKGQGTQTGGGNRYLAIFANPIGAFVEPAQGFIQLYPFLCSGFQQCDLLGACCITQRHVFDVQHGIVAKVRMIISMLRNQMIDLPLQRRASSDEERAQHLWPSVVDHLIHRWTPGEL